MLWHHPESMQGLTFQQPPSCYSYSWKIITPFWELSSCFYLFIYRYLPLFRKSPESPFFSNIFCFFKKKSGESHDHHPPTRNTHQLWTRSGRTSQVSPLACCHWARLALANFFFTFRVQELTMFTHPPQKKVVKTPPFKKKGWQVNIETIQEKGEVFILCDYVAKCFERTSNGFRCNQATG